MYCSSCGIALAPGLSFCNRCGANLSAAAKDHGVTKPPVSPVNQLFEGIVLTTLFGMGIIFGGVVAMKALEVKEALIVAYMILSSAAFLGIYGMYIRQFFLLDRSNKEISGAKVTKELYGRPARTLPEPVPSVTDHTTRTLEPVYREPKSG